MLSAALILQFQQLVNKLQRPNSGSPLAFVEAETETLKDALFELLSDYLKDETHADDANSVMLLLFNRQIAEQHLAEFTETIHIHHIKEKEDTDNYKIVVARPPVSRRHLLLEHGINIDDRNHRIYSEDTPYPRVYQHTILKEDGCHDKLGNCLSQLSKLTASEDAQEFLKAISQVLIMMASYVKYRNRLRDEKYHPKTVTEGLSFADFNRSFHESVSHQVSPDAKSVEASAVKSDKLAMDCKQDEKDDEDEDEELERQIMAELLFHQS